MKKISKKLISLLLIISMVIPHFIYPLNVYADGDKVTITVDVNGGNELSTSVITVDKGKTLSQIIGEMEEGPLFYSFINMRKQRTYLNGIVNSSTNDPIDPDNDPINDDIGIKFLWGQSELYGGNIEIQVDPPIIGEVYEVQEVPGQMTISVTEQDPTPSMTTNFDVFDIAFENRMLLYNDCEGTELDPYENAECLKPFAGTVEAGKTYYISLVLTINDEYYLPTAEPVLTVNGNAPQQLNIYTYENNDFREAYVVVEVQAVEGNPNQEEFEITYETDGGTVINKETVHDGEKAPRPNPDPEKENYIFAGWYSDDGRNNPYDFDDPVHQNRTIYAKWEEKNISIVASPSSIDFGEVLVNPQEHIQRVVKITNNGNTNVTLTLNNPTSDGPFGSLNFNSIDLDVGANIDVTLIVNKDADKSAVAGNYSGDYTFTASDCGGDGETSIDVHATVTMVAEAPQTHTVSFETYGGTPVPNSVTVNHGDKVTPPSEHPQKQGWEFDVWCSDETATQPFDFGNSITSDTIIYAKYREEGHQGGGNEPATIVVTPNSVDFGTFYIGSTSDIYKQVTVTNDNNVDMEVTISSPSNEGPFNALEIDPFVVAAGTSQNVNLIVDHGAQKASTAGTYHGQYVFSYNEVGVQMGDEALVDASLTVADPPAVEKVTITFEANGGTPVPNQVQIDKGTKVTKPAQDPAKENYVFDAWCSDETTTQPYDFDTPVNSNITLYARYNEKLEILDDTNNQEYNPESGNSEEGLTIRVSGALADLIKIEVDGEEVGSQYVQLTSGSTIAKFTKAFLDTLSGGSHTVTFYYNSGNISAGFTIHKTNITNNTSTQTTTNNVKTPSTGDDITKWITLLAISSITLTGIVLVRKKKH